MNTIVTSDFTKTIFSPPSGQRKTNPSIFDELRWATQHIQHPLEQILQLLTEFHGPWTGGNANTAALTNSSITSNSQRSYATTANAANSLNNSTNLGDSTIGRFNQIIANNMTIPLYREYIAKFQAIHPAINNFLQNNITNYQHFQEISNILGSFSQIVLNTTDVSIPNRIQSNGANTMTTNNRLSRNSAFKQLPPLSTLIEESSKLVDTLFCRAIRPNNTSLLNADSSTPHGFSFMMDSLNANRIKASVSECKLQTIQKFGPTLQLCDAYFPVNYQIQTTIQLYDLTSDGDKYKADGFNSPLTRDVNLIMASDSNTIATI